MSWTIERQGRVAVVMMTTNPVNAQNRAFFADLHEAAKLTFRTSRPDCQVSAGANASIMSRNRTPLPVRRIGKR